MASMVSQNSWDMSSTWKRLGCSSVRNAGRPMIRGGICTSPGANPPCKPTPRVTVLKIWDWERGIHARATSAQRGQKPCDCDAYDPPEDPKKRSKCRECGHGKSKHSPIPNELPGGGGNKRDVLDVFNAHSSVKIAEALPAKDKVTDFNVARKDALKNFRVKEDSKQLKPKRKIPTIPPPLSKSKDIVIVSEIVLFTCGIKFSDKLAELFPQAFLPSGGTAWRILGKEYQRLNVVRKDEPAGADITLVKEVSETVYNSWYIGPDVIKDSSSIHDGDEDLIQDTASEDDASSDDYNPANDPDADVDMEGDIQIVSNHKFS
ncbi:hypothetical protein B0H12DRAFT_1080533 [Mycena haematopus]|nr:hypothetical protein B0H12DRAFT_1080533 [Mycena haematopus]